MLSQQSEIKREYIFVFLPFRLYIDIRLFQREKEKKLNLCLISSADKFNFVLLYDGKKKKRISAVEKIKKLFLLQEVVDSKIGAMKLNKLILLRVLRIFKILHTQCLKEKR